MTRQIPTLDGWRAVAIFCVLFSHGYPSIQRAFGFPDLHFREPLGIFGVEIFFALSGYLITTKLLQEEKRDGSMSLAHFYFRRVFRIMPAALTLIVVTAVLSFIGVLPPIAPSRLLSTVFFAANYSDAPFSYYLAHFWSLAVEEHFYFVWPTILILCVVRQRLAVAIGLAILIAIWRALLWKIQVTTEDAAKFYGRTDIIVDAILWGSTLGLVAFNKPGSLRFISSHAVWLSIAAISVFAALFKSSGWKLDMALFTLTRLTIPHMIYGTVVDSNSFFGKVLESAPFRFIGRISYSLYLWQQIFLIIPVESMATKPFEYLQLFPLNLLCAFFCAIVSYKIVEQPLIKLGRSAFAHERGVMSA